jgi:hypothetical protein
MIMSARNQPFAQLGAEQELVYATPNRVSDFYTLDPADTTAMPQRPLEGKVAFL